jgi:hypothetical protein
MTGWAGRRDAERRGISRAQAQWLIGSVVVICALGFYGYKHWNAPPPTADKIRAIEVLAKMHGWIAPEKAILSAESKIGRIERVIVEPKNRDGGGVPPPAGGGTRE